jgi:hypothetical protein
MVAMVSAIRNKIDFFMSICFWLFFSMTKNIHLFVKGKCFSAERIWPWSAAEVPGGKYDGASGKN